MIHDTYLCGRLLIERHLNHVLGVQQAVFYLVREARLLELHQDGNSRIIMLGMCLVKDEVRSFLKSGLLHCPPVVKHLQCHDVTSCPCKMKVLFFLPV